MNARQTAIVVFMGFGLGMLAGQRHERAERRVEVAELHSAHAEEQRLASRAATARLQAAQARGDQLTERLAENERQLQTLTKEKRDALKKVTSGRACLGTAALRVLDGAPGLRVADLPEATGSAAAADGPVATDSDIGQWSLGAGAQYEQCRKRLGTLIDWHTKEPQP